MVFWNHLGEDLGYTFELGFWEIVIMFESGVSQLNGSVFESVGANSLQLRPRASTDYQFHCLAPVDVHIDNVIDCLMAPHLWHNHAAEIQDQKADKRERRSPTPISDEPMDCLAQAHEALSSLHHETESLPATSSSACGLPTANAQPSGPRQIAQATFSSPHDDKRGNMDGLVVRGGERCN